MTETLDVGSLQVEPGNVENGWINGVELNTTHQIDIPVIGMNGAHDGPTLVLQSMVHGIELQNVAAVHELMREKISPSELQGQIITIPIANPLAYMHATYHSWIDNKDVLDESVESPDAGPSARLANALWEEAWSQADMALDFHANTRPDSLPFQIIRVREDTEEEQERMARAFGLTTIRFEGLAAPVHQSEDSGEGPPISEVVTPNIRNKAALAGIPEMTVELMDGRWFSEPSQSSVIEGSINLMKEFGMLDGEPDTGHELQRNVGVDIIPCQYTGGSGLNRSIGFIRSNHGGILHTTKTPGEPVAEGEVIARIVDLHGELVEEVQMPEDGYLWAYPGGQFLGTTGALQTVETGGPVAFAMVHEE